MWEVPPFGEVSTSMADHNEKWRSSEDHSVVMIQSNPTGVPSMHRCMGLE